MVLSGLEVLALTTLLALASAGPLHRSPREIDDYQNIDAYANYTANEVCFSDNEVFQKGDMMPNPGPCEECRCEPPSIVCNMIKCPVNNNGCRTIQKPNHCCPDYNCECDYNGQLYNDGERLDLPDEPCQVCYCKGGEVMCTSITCYHRDDCDPIQVPGQCCPKYENCPLRDMGVSSYDDKQIRTRSSNKTSPKREMTPWLLTKSAPHTSSLPSSKAPETTTENGNIIIVSDWLSERKTTTEDSIKPNGTGKEDHITVHTEVPRDVKNNGQGKEIVSQQQDTLTIYPGHDVLVQNHQTIGPVEEVIFTRIDSFNGKSKNSNSPVHQEENGIIITTDPTNSLNKSSDKPTSTVASVTAAPVEKLQLKVHHPALDGTINSPVTDFESNTSPTSTNASIQQKEVERVQESYENLHTDKPGGFDSSSTSTLSYVNNTDELRKGNYNLSNETHYNNDSNKKFNQSIEYPDKHKFQPEDITLEQLFGFDRTDEMEANRGNTTNSQIKIDNESNINSNGDSFETIDTTSVNLQTTEKLQPFIGKDYVAGDSVENNEKVDKTVADYNKKDFENIAESTTRGYNELETSTVYFIEDHMVTNNLESVSPFQEYSEEDTTISNEESSTHSEKTAFDQVENTERGFTNNTFNSNKSDITVINFTLEAEDTTASPSSKVQNIESFNEGKIANSLSHYSINQSEGITETNSFENIENSGIVKNITSREADTISEKHNIMESDHTKVEETNESLQGVGGNENFMLWSTVDDISIESREGVSDPPFILDLNSHVPFLQIGGQEVHDSSSQEVEGGQEIPTTGQTHDLFSALSQGNSSKIQEHQYLHSFADLKLESSTTEKISTQNINDTKQNVPKGQTNDNIAEMDIDTTSHIPLTPDDLKALAEYLINEKITPVSSKNESLHSTNDWLRGNLTSEEKIATIMTAANVSIGIMNKTVPGTFGMQSNTNLTSNDLVKKLKNDKDFLYKGNSISSAEKAVANKSGIFRDKINESPSILKSMSKFDLSAKDTTSSDGKTTVIGNTKTDLSMKFEEKNKTQTVFRVEQHPPRDMEPVILFQNTEDVSRYNISQGKLEVISENYVHTTQKPDAYNFSNNGSLQKNNNLTLHSEIPKPKRSENKSDYPNQDTEVYSQQNSEWYKADKMESTSSPKTINDETVVPKVEKNNGPTIKDVVQTGFLAP